LIRINIKLVSNTYNNYYYLNTHTPRMDVTYFLQSQSPYSPTSKHKTPISLTAAHSPVRGPISTVDEQPTYVDPNQYLMSQPTYPPMMMGDINPYGMGMMN